MPQIYVGYVNTSGGVYTNAVVADNTIATRAVAIKARWWSGGAITNNHVDFIQGGGCGTNYRPIVLKDSTGVTLSGNTSTGYP